MTKEAGSRTVELNSSIRHVDLIMSKKILLSGGVLLFLFHLSLVHAESQDFQDEAGYAASTLDARVARLEKKAATQPLTEVVREMDRLKDDVKKLRGQVEELRNAMERQSRDAGDQNAALIQKNAELQARLQQGEAAVAPPAATPPATEASGAAAAPPVASAPPAVESPKSPSTVDAALAAPKPQPVAVDPMSRQKEYEHAFETLKAAKYTEAISEFQSFVAKYPTGDFSDSAHYWLGEALYVNRAFIPAREAFRKMIADFPQSAKVADAKLKLAYIEYENQQYPKARELLTDIVKSYPNSATAKMAEKRLERMHQENR